MLQQQPAKRKRTGEDLLKISQKTTNSPSKFKIQKTDKTLTTSNLIVKTLTSKTPLQNRHASTFLGKQAVPTTANKTTKKLTKGRQKTLTSFISDKKERGVSFCKRKKGLIKKANELNTLTGAHVALIIVNENYQVHKYFSESLKPLDKDDGIAIYQNIRHLIDEFRKQSGELVEGRRKNNGNLLGAPLESTYINQRAQNLTELTTPNVPFNIPLNSNHNFNQVTQNALQIIDEDASDQIDTEIEEEQISLQNLELLKGSLLQESDADLPNEITETLPEDDDNDENNNMNDTAPDEEIIDVLGTDTQEEVRNENIEALKFTENTGKENADLRRQIELLQKQLNGSSSGVNNNNNKPVSIVELQGNKPTQNTFPKRDYYSKASNLRFLTETGQLRTANNNVSNLNTKNLSPATNKNNSQTNLTIQQQLGHLLKSSNAKNPIIIKNTTNHITIAAPASSSIISSNSNLNLTSNKIQNSSTTSKIIAANLNNHIDSMPTTAAATRINLPPEISIIKPAAINTKKLQTSLTNKIEINFSHGSISTFSRSTKNDKQPECIVNPLCSKWSYKHLEELRDKGIKSLKSTFLDNNDNSNSCPAQLLFRKNSVLVENFTKTTNKSNIPNSLINLKLNQAILTPSHHFVNCEKIIHCMPPIFTDRKGTVNTPKFGLYWQNFNEESEYGFGGVYCKRF